MPATLHDVWTATVERDPAAIALIEAATGRRWTRAELAATGDAWQKTVPAGTDLRGRIVVFALPNGAEWWRIFLGLISVQAIPAALDPGESIEAQGRAAGSIGAAYIWTDGRLEPVGEKLPCRQSRAVALIKVTSGSTGAPRVFKFTAAQMLADGRQVCSSMDIRADDLNLAVIPFGHSYGLGNLVMPLLAQGTASLCSSGSLPQTLAAECRQFRATVFPAVPALLRILAASDLPADSLQSLRVVISAGATLPAETAQAFHAKFQRLVHSFYGSSETGGIAYDRDGSASLEGRSVGAPLDGVTLEFRRGRRFTVASAAVMGTGRFSPADRGELNAEGELLLLGRTGRVVKIAGRRLDLGEIETALRSIPQVSDAFAAPHPRQAEAIAVAVATSLDSRAMRSALQKRLAAWKIPSRIVTMQTFPLTARGKPDTRALRAKLAGN